MMEKMSGEIEIIKGIHNGLYREQMVKSFTAFGTALDNFSRLFYYRRVEKIVLKDNKKLHKRREDYAGNK